MYIRKSNPVVGLCSLNYQRQNVNLNLYYSTGCALWFQRIEEIIYDSDEPTAASSTCSQRGSMNPRIRKSNKRKRAATSGDEEEEEDIRAFQRVRLLLKSRQSRDASQFDPKRSHSRTAWAALMPSSSPKSRQTAHREPNLRSGALENGMNPA
jgi:hypothetical protein